MRDYIVTVRVSHHHLVRAANMDEAMRIALAVQQTGDDKDATHVVDVTADMRRGRS
jgi:hypothetical protein